MIYFPGKELHPAEHLADWVYYRREIQVADCDLMKHGREQEKIVTVNEPHFYRIAGEFLLQLHRDCQAHKAAAQNDYPLSRRIVHEAPPTCSERSDDVAAKKIRKIRYSRKHPKLRHLNPKSYTRVVRSRWAA